MKAAAAGDDDVAASVWPKAEQVFCHCLRPIIIIILFFNTHCRSLQRFGGRSGTTCIMTCSEM
jgi:hypothetical protein